MHVQFIEIENKLKMHQPCLLDYGYGYHTAVKQTDHPVTSQISTSNISNGL